MLFKNNFSFTDDVILVNQLCYAFLLFQISLILILFFPVSSLRRLLFNPDFPLQLNFDSYIILLLIALFSLFSPTSTEYVFHFSRLKNLRVVQPFSCICLFSAPAPGCVCALSKGCAVFGQNNRLHLCVSTGADGCYSIGLVLGLKINIHQLPGQLTLTNNNNLVNLLVRLLPHSPHVLNNQIR